jgi:hypothetical protein
MELNDTCGVRKSTLDAIHERKDGLNLLKDFKKSVSGKNNSI